MHSLNALKFSNYEWVILFCGPQNKKVEIDLASVASTKLEITRIDKSAKDNLDFDLSLYLARYHELVDENVEFVVFSNGSGLDGVVDQMTTLGSEVQKG
ncbi:MAG: PIN domain-containing protein [Rubritalea sp.]|uniref:PIN domain-containing protein n=1 Tax=Rubritalea sp. TaxID=2109375 RepID=UPI0032420830